jgi:predicted metal-dependent HD superfamily phosphohydrolase
MGCDDAGAADREHDPQAEARMLHYEWSSTCAQAGMPVHHDFVYFSFVKQYYNSVGRVYHNLNHIKDCLRQFNVALCDPDRQASSPNPTCPKEVKLAIWLHDIIYDTKTKDNEERSADLAKMIVLFCGGSPEMADRIHRMICLTKRDKHNFLSTDEQWLLDVDLSILGANAEEYDKYALAIRTEYDWVPKDIYCKTRIKLLTALRRRRPLYYIDYFNKRFAKQADENMTREISQLQS